MLFSGLVLINPWFGFYKDFHLRQALGMEKTGGEVVVWLVLVSLVGIPSWQLLAMLVDSTCLLNGIKIAWV